MTKTESPSVNVLIANDNPTNTRILTKYLKQLGHNPEVANNGKEALEAYQNNPEGYQWILMKPSMPVMNGMESTRRIREFEREGNLEQCGIVWLVASMLSLRQDLLREYAVTATMKWPVKLNHFAQVLNEAGLPTMLPETSLAGGR